MIKFRRFVRGILRSLMGQSLVRYPLQQLSYHGLLPQGLWKRLPAEGTFRVAPSDGVTFSYAAVQDDGIGRVLFWRGWQSYEPETMKVFYSLAQKAHTVLDIGANTGVFSLVACAASKSAKVIAFEPVPLTFQRLQENIRLNGWEQQCQVHNVAVSNYCGLAQFHVPNTILPSSASLHVQGFRNFQGSLLQVPVTTVDTLCASEKVDLVKIDVEGFEDKALEGMSEVLKRSKPALIVECNPDGPFHAVEDVLRQFNYEFFHLRHGGPVPVDGIVPDAYERFRNFLCLHSSDTRSRKDLR